MRVFNFRNNSYNRDKKQKYTRLCVHSSENLVWIEYDVTVISREFLKRETGGGCFGWRRTPNRIWSTDNVTRRTCW